MMSLLLSFIDYIDDFFTYQQCG